MVSVYFQYPQGGIDPGIALAEASNSQAARLERLRPFPAPLYGGLGLDNGDENIIVASPDGQNTIIQKVEAPPYRRGRRGQIHTNDSNSQDGVDRIIGNLHFPSRTSNRQEKLNSRNSRSTHKTMKHNAKMRKNHRIQQPGFDVQRFGGK